MMFNQHRQEVDLKSIHLLLAFIASSLLPATVGALAWIARDTRVKSILTLAGLQSPDVPLPTSLNSQVDLLPGLSSAP